MTHLEKEHATIANAVESHHIGKDSTPELTHRSRLAMGFTHMHAYNIMSHVTTCDTTWDKMHLIHVNVKQNILS